MTRTKPLPFGSDEAEQLASILESHPDYRIVRRLAPRKVYTPPNGRPVAKGIIADTETTGLRHGEDKIIEIGMVAFEFDPQTGDIFRVLGTYSGLEDPGMPIPPESTRVHGISDEMVAGKEFNEREIAAFVANAAVIIAHNAGFDRPFLESRFPLFENLPWACSFAQVKWDEEGLSSLKLDYIAYRLGFFYDAHRAQTDCLALLEALHLTLPVSGGKALSHILAQYQLMNYKVWARGSKFDTKDMLKERAYRWDGDEKCWYKNVDAEALAAETAWLKAAIYGGRATSLDVEVFDATLRFSRRSGRKEAIQV